MDHLGHEDATPKYRAIADHYRRRIMSGDLKPGDEVPSERAVAQQFEVARPTATKALELLRQAGLVESRQGSGTRVTPRPVAIQAQGRSEHEARHGVVYPKGVQARIVRAELETSPPDEVRAALGLAPDEAAIRRHRIIDTPEGPAESSTSWFPPALAEVAPRLLSTERIREGTEAYVETATGRRRGSAEEKVAARRATDAEAQAFALVDGSPVLVVHRLILDREDRVLEFVEAVFPPERWAHHGRRHFD